MLVVDVDGYALIINFEKQVVLAHFNFGSKVTALAFSPDSKFFGVASGTKLRIFETPQLKKSFAPLIVYKKYGNLHSQDIIQIVWSPDSRFFVTTSLDLTIKMISLHKIDDFQPFTFTGNKRKIVKCFFSKDGLRLFSLGEKGTLLIWKWVDEVSEGAKAVLNFHQFKSQKRLKTGTNPNEYILTNQDKSLQTDFE